ncbi:hypothetical protein [Brevibacterium litoralis]|uniref:hypothetical protein n=1 Tax=Brevibacterium litoralis TaxID=3138935 RepID=UPI0032ECD9E6
MPHAVPIPLPPHLRIVTVRGLAAVLTTTVLATLSLVAVVVTFAGHVLAADAGGPVTTAVLASASVLGWVVALGVGIALGTPVLLARLRVAGTGRSAPTPADEAPRTSRASVQGASGAGDGARRPPLRLVSGPTGVPAPCTVPGSPPRLPDENLRPVRSDDRFAPTGRKVSLGAG